MGSLIGKGLVTRLVSLPASEQVFLKGVLEASEGLASLFSEQGALVTLAAPSSRERELDLLLEHLAAELPDLHVCEGRDC